MSELTAPRRRRLLARRPRAGRQPSPAAHTPTGVTGLHLLDTALDKAVTIPSGVVHEHVMRLRRRYPHATPGRGPRDARQAVRHRGLDAGGAVGAAAAAPAIGTGVGIALTASEVAAFFATSAAYGLAVASVHGIEVTDVPRRRTLLLATLLGDQGRALVTQEAGLPAATGSWARSVLTGLPTSTIKRVNRALARRWVKRYAAREGALAIGRLLPFGVGALIGVTGARAHGPHDGHLRASARSARRPCASRRSSSSAPRCWTRPPRTARPPDRPRDRGTHQRACTCSRMRSS